MFAIDANLVVRYLYLDDPDQCARARSLIDGGRVWVATTVLLETAWVLRAVHGKSQEEITRGFRLLAGLPTVELQDPDIVSGAIDLAERGLEIGDAFHMAASRQCDAFVTFDRRCINTATRLGLAARSS
jgi:predicted nucleic-acid-binding protein